jgi:hypothetical protein
MPLSALSFRWRCACTVIAAVACAQMAHAQAAISDLPMLPSAETSPAPVSSAQKSEAPSAKEPSTATNESVPDAPELPAEFSFGTHPYSLFFSTDQITQMKQALEEAETRLAAGTPPEPLAVPTIAPPAPPEPPSYPNFYLSSIVYRGPGSWVFWMNGQQYTPKNPPPEMQVLAISSEAVTLLWQPTFLEDAVDRMKQKEFSQTIPSNLLAQKSEPGVVYDSDRGGLIFTLRLNQSYVGGAFAVYEGRYDEMPVPPLGGASAANVSEATPSSGSAGSPQIPQMVMDQDTLNQLQQIQNNLGLLRPRNTQGGQQVTPPSPAPAPSQSPAASVNPPAVTPPEALPPAATPGAAPGLPMMPSPSATTSPPPDRTPLF